MTTITDLPDDMLYEIFGHLFAERDIEGELPEVDVTGRPRGMHTRLRRVCRRWRPLADWARLDNAMCSITASKFADVDAVRVRHPTATKKISVLTRFTMHASGKEFLHSNDVQRAVASIIEGNPVLHRVLQHAHFEVCCLASVARVVSPLASCAGLTKLMIAFHAHKKQRAVPDTLLAPLSALGNLRNLVLSYTEDAQQGSVMPLAAWPVIPDAPRLTSLALQAATLFVPRGSDAALGRLRTLKMQQVSLPIDSKSTEDWFGLRAAFDAGTWQPQRLAGVDHIMLIVDDTVPNSTPFRPPQPRSAAGSEWLPLAGQITGLELLTRVPSRTRVPSTGIAAGLGVLTALKSLRVNGTAVLASPEFVPPVEFGRLRLPYLTQLKIDCVPTAIDLAAFPNLVDIHVVAYKPRQRPVMLRSLAGRTRLKSLVLSSANRQMPVMNLAELFAGGGGLPALRKLTLDDIVLTWNTAGLSGVPSAAEFGVAVRTLLPSLTDSYVFLPQESTTDAAKAACWSHVLPALVVVAHPMGPRLKFDNPAAPPNLVRAAGNKAYAEKRWADAIDAYTRALEASQYRSPDWIAALSNRAAAKLGAGDAEGAAFDADAVLVAASGNIKARLRRAMARERVGNKEGAAFDYEKVLKLAPNTVQAAEGLERVRG